MSEQASGELYFQWGVMVIVFIVHSLADGLMNFPSRYFRGTAPKKLIFMKGRKENCCNCLAPVCSY